ncbi:MAG: hypothetical protein Q7J68_07760 [Thermoplasmata archaeon]|nr:hypothetical protein [Thermoplasmata archaeon]
MTKNNGSGQKPRAKSNKSVKGSDKVYTLAVYVIGGPVAKEFDEKEISRTIQIRGTQTLENLHCAIFCAFDRWEEHLYEFILGKGPDDRSAIYSSHAYLADWGYGDEEMGDVADTAIDSLGLKVDRAFGYRFDFGDEWVHQINVVAINEEAGEGKYPKIIKRVGKSPPQYPDIEE